MISFLGIFKDFIRHISVKNLLINCFVKIMDVCIGNAPPKILWRLMEYFNKPPELFSQILDFNFLNRYYFMQVSLTNQLLK